MKVGYLTGTYPRATDTFIQREVAGVRAAGVEVRTFAVRRPGPEHLVGPEQVAEHATTTYLLPPAPAATLKAHLGLLARAPRRYLKALRLAARTAQPGAKGWAYQAIYLAEAGTLAAAVRADHIDHLHNHLADQSGTVTMLAAAMAGVPFSMTVHGPHIFFEPGRWALGVKADQAAFVSCISEFARSQVMVFADQTSWDRLAIVHCGVWPASFAAPEAPPAGRFRIIVVGRLAAEKGLPVLLRAAAARRAELPGLTIDLIGDGPDREALEKLAASLGLADAVRFLGSQGQAEVREALAGTDVLVSAGFAEGIPTALMEALAGRVPVIASAVAGVRELVTDGVCGRLVAPGSQAELGDALVELHQMGPAARRAWGDAGRAVVELAFDADREAAKLAALFRATGPAAP